MMTKRLLQKGAVREMKNGKGENCIDIANRKDNREIIKILNPGFHCQLCAVKMPYIKVEGNKWGIFFFVFIHVFAEFFGFFTLIPCKYYTYNTFKTSITFIFQVYT